MVSLILLIAIAAACLLGPYLLPWRLAESTGAPSTPRRASRAGIVGTDANGRDLLIRMLYGGRVSLSVALVASLVSLVIGVLYGAIAGYRRRARWTAT